MHWASYRWIIARMIGYGKLGMSLTLRQGFGIWRFEVDCKVMESGRRIRQRKPLLLHCDPRCYFNVCPKADNLPH